MAKKAVSKVAKKGQKSNPEPSGKKGRLSRYNKIESNIELFKIVKKLKKGASVTKTAKTLTGDEYVGVTTRKKTIELFKAIATIQFSKSPLKEKKFEKLTFTRV